MMQPRKKEHPTLKPGLHPRNKHRARYDFKALSNTEPALARWVKVNEYNDASIDFANPDAVKVLNKALLKHFYGIGYWDIPPQYLCPPIPGRADYIHYLADLLAATGNGTLPKGEHIKCLDVGVGANCVYPIIGNREYGWSFAGSDIDSGAIKSASYLIAQNPVLQGQIDLRLQTHRKDIFKGIIRQGEYFDVTLCNPPFHASAAEAQAGTLRKLSNLKGKRVGKAVLNFGGQGNELWCEGGEARFIQNMITQSSAFSASCLWFTTLVSKSANLKGAYHALHNAKATEVKTIPMEQGNKISRILAWTFLTPHQQQEWVKARWK
jgi:23S rRNA (adenine1618-N6)-methyltransferase